MIGRGGVDGSQQAPGGDVVDAGEPVKSSRVQPPSVGAEGEAWALRRVASKRPGAAGRHRPDGDPAGRGGGQQLPARAERHGHRLSRAAPGPGPNTQPPQDPPAVWVEEHDPRPGAHRHRAPFRRIGDPRRTAADRHASQQAAGAGVVQSHLAATVRLRDLPPVGAVCGSQPDQCGAARAANMDCGQADVERRRVERGPEREQRLRARPRPHRPHPQDQRDLGIVGQLRLTLGRERLGACAYLLRYGLATRDQREDQQADRHSRHGHAADHHRALAARGGRAAGQQILALQRCGRGVGVLGDARQP